MPSLAAGGGKLRGLLEPELHASVAGHRSQGDEVGVLADERGNGVVLTAASDHEERLGDVGEEVGGDADAQHAVWPLDGDGEMAARLLQLLGSKEGGGVAVRAEPQERQ